MGARMASMCADPEPGDALAPYMAVETRLTVLDVEDDALLGEVGAPRRGTAARRKRHKHSKKRRLTSLLDGFSSSASTLTTTTTTAVGPVLLEWTELLNPETRETYYLEARSQERRRTKPRGFEEGVTISSTTMTRGDDDDENARPNTKSRRGRSVADRVARLGSSYWIKVEDSKHRTYYYDVLSKRTRWERPTAYRTPDRKKRTRSIKLANGVRTSLRLSQRYSTDLE